MSLWSRMRDRMTGEAARQPGEADTPPDAQEARSRETGGAPDSESPDSHSTTGTTPNQTFVGRASGDDAGDAEKSGAERRAEHHGRDRHSGGPEPR
jgi:hypothetical protein